MMLTIYLFQTMMCLYVWKKKLKKQKDKTNNKQTNKLEER